MESINFVTPSRHEVLPGASNKGMYLPILSAYHNSYQYIGNPFRMA